MLCREGMCVGFRPGGFVDAHINYECSAGVQIDIIIFTVAAVGHFQRDLSAPVRAY